MDSPRAAYTGISWTSDRQPMGSLWISYGQPMVNPRTGCGLLMGCPIGQPIGIPPAPRGQLTGSVRAFHGQPMDSTWAVHGQPTGQLTYGP